MRIQENMIGDSAALALALEQISHLAPINRSVLILGARGTGKELAAERMHFLSTRWDGPLQKVNCAALAESLLESELFGHEPGAFTGATRVHRGRFERAEGGTLFLDELGTMSMQLQEKLLRVLEYGEFERLGGQETIKVDVRVVAATNANLRDLSSQKKFRDDLLDRLSFDIVHLPSLSQRPEDIPTLAQHFGIQMSAELGWELFPGFTERASTKLSAHDWPGNIRELKNAVERSLYRWGDQENAIDEIIIDPFQSPYEETQPGAMDELHHATADADTTEHQIDYSAAVRNFEENLLRRSLQDHGGNQRRAAESLGLSYDQMRGMVRKYALTTRTRRKAEAP